jgi:hypothetical protein
MKKFKMFSLALTLALVFSSMGGATGFAAAKSKVIDVGSAKSGFKISVPNFVAIKKVKSKDMDGAAFETTVIVMKTPKKDKKGAYPIFEIVTTNKKAYRVSSYPGTYTDGQMGSFQDQLFTKGKLMYSPTFAIQGDLKNIVKDKVFMFDFTVSDKDSKVIFAAENLNFMFVN